MLIFLILVLIIINLYQVVIGLEATLSVVGANGAVRHSYYAGNRGGAGGVIQIIASSGLVTSGSRLWLRKGNKICQYELEDSGDGFLLIKGARNTDICIAIIFNAGAQPAYGAVGPGLGIL